MRQHIRTIGGLVAGVILGATAVAVAAIPDSTTSVISACMKTRDGTIRLIDYQAGRRCVGGETLVTWNQKGAAGAPGAPGAAGLPGAQGPAGAVGPQGPQGIPGEVGPQGAVGPQGESGVQGPAGADGSVGPKGDNGANGEPGAPGPGPMIVGLVNPSRVELSTNDLWEALPSATTSLPPQSFDRTAVVTFWSGAACFGVGYKYAQLYIDGVASGSAPLAPIPNSGFSELQSSTTQLVTIPAGRTTTVSVKVQTAPGTSCVFVEKYWSLSIVATSSS